MSAFIVSEGCVDDVVAVIYGLNPTDWPVLFGGRLYGSADELGRALYDLNARSVEERYGERDPVPYYTFVAPGPELDRHQLYKSVACFTYQACEGDCPQDPLYKALAEVERRLHQECGKRLWDDRAWDRARIQETWKAA